MNTIYWITRLDDIRGFIFAIITLSVLICVFVIINLWVEEDMDFKFIIRKLRTFIVLILSLSVLSLFIPNEKDMLLIYGVGGTIEYLQENDTAKQLPDKCVKALDKFVEEYIGDETEKTDK